MPTYLDPTTINALEGEMKLFIKSRFTQMVGVNELKIEAKVDNAFTVFFDKILGDGLRATFITTNYDYIIEKIIKNTSVEVSLNRGVIDKKQFDKKAWQKNKVNVFKINGGFEINNTQGEACIDYEANDCEPNIILASQEQNYSDQYFENVFLKSASKLREADTIVFIGYSFPKEDHTIRFLLKNFIDSNNEEKEIVIIGRDHAGSKETKKQAALLFPDLAEKEAIHAFDGSLEDLLTQVKVKGPTAG